MAGAPSSRLTSQRDDLDRLGWDNIGRFPERGGICGFRLIPAERVEALRSALTVRGFRLDTWDVFLADRETALNACETNLASGLPEDIVDFDRPTRPYDE